MWSFLMFYIYVVIFFFFKVVLAGLGFCYVEWYLKFRFFKVVLC